MKPAFKRYYKYTVSAPPWHFIFVPMKMMRSLPSATAITLVVSACDAFDAWGDSVVLGHKNRLSNGFLQTYVLLDDGGDPIEVGVQMDLGLFDTDEMPTRKSDGKYDIYDPEDRSGDPVWYCCGHEAELTFPGKVAKEIPFAHLVANYSPLGHNPPDIYDVAHWDFHFYAIKRQERLSVKTPKFEEVCAVPDLPFDLPFIPITCEDFCYQNQYVPCDQLPPPPYFNPLVAVEPGMGSHL